ncbi:MAG: DUF2834 domain-containing protein [Pseudomonadota bacterium]
MAPRRRTALSRPIYLILALAGAAIPLRRYISWISENGFDGGAAMAAVSANGLTLGLGGTMLIVTLAVLVFIVTECAARRDEVAILAAPVTLVMGVAAGLPLYLFLRSRKRA